MPQTLRHFITGGTTLTPGLPYYNATSPDQEGGAGTQLIFQTDGNLVAYDVNHNPIWASGTAGPETGDAGARCTFQTDGNLVVYDGGNQPIWASGTSGNPNALLTIQDDGNIVIYQPFPRAIWNTDTERPAPIDLGLRMQYQLTDDWCWLTVATSISHYYDPDSTWTQDALMTIIGNQVNKWDPQVSCSPTPAMFAAHPGVEETIADPYLSGAQNALDNVGIPAQCIKTGGINTALQYTGNLAGTADTMSANDIASEINSGRPVCVDIYWGGNLATQHVVVLCGLDGEYLLIADPAYGTAFIASSDFPGNYHGGAAVLSYCTTQAAS